MSTVLLAILDGVAIRKEIPGNAFKQANKMITYCMKICKSFVL